MYSVHQPRLFSRDLVLYDREVPVAEINHRSFTDTADIVIGADRYEARRLGWWRPTYQLGGSGGIVATAEADGFWRRAYRLEVAGTTYRLRRMGWLRHGWELLDGDTVVGTVERNGFFRTQTTVNLPARVPVAGQAFIVWLANVLWRQDQSAAAVVVSS